MKILSQETNLGTGTTVSSATVVRAYNSDSNVGIVTRKDSGGSDIGNLTVPSGKVVYLEKKFNDTLIAPATVKASKIAYSPMMQYASWTAGGGGGGGASGAIYDLDTGSLPTGMYQISTMSTPTLTWDSTGAKFTGDSSNTSSYPLRIASSFSGDYLFQLSTRIDQDTNPNNWCSDASLAVFNTTYDGSTWTWKWGNQSGRIAAQNNCDTPHLYGTSTTQAINSPNSGDVLKSPYLSSGDWVTMHMYHEPTLSRTRYKVTLGSKDWGATGTQIGNSPNSGILEISESFSGTYWVGISGDDDSDSMYANGFKYSSLA